MNINERRRLRNTRGEEIKGEDYLESDRDYVLNNLDAAVELLDAACRGVLPTPVKRASGPDHYCVLLRADGTEVERWEVSNTVPKTIGWNLSLEAGRHGLGRDVARSIAEDSKQL